MIRKFMNSKGEFVGLSMGIVHSCLALIQIGKKKEAEKLMEIYKLTKEINIKSKGKPNIII